MNNNALMSENIDCLAKALSKMQAAIENVSKDKQAYGYKYADLASCLAAVKKPLSENGFSISQLVGQDEDKNPLLITLLIHESGQWLKSTFPIENVVMKQCNSLQQLGAGLTYTRRYALSAIVGLTQEDDDAQSLPKKDPQSVLKTPEKEHELSPAQKLKGLCLKHKLDIKEFTTFHEINSDTPETVKNGVENFELLKAKFENAKINNTH